MADKTDALDRLKSAGSGLLQAAGEKALSTAGDKVKGLTSHLEGVADGGPLMKAVSKGAEAKAGGDSPVMGALKGLGSGVKDKITGGGSGGGSGGKESKSVNILETIDVGVPIDVAYNAWTEFGEFPSFMRKVEQAEAKEEAKIEWKAQIFLSHRTWEATILDQIPNERIVWRSKGEKGHVDGAVTFHEVTPTLTRIMVVLEYYPQGFFEKTGNLWRAQGRRARSDLRHFKRHVMTRSILEAEEIEGWRGVIEDGEVVKTHDEVVEEEEQAEESEDGAEPEDEYDEPDEESEEDAEPEDEYEEPEEGEEEAEPEDEYEEPEDGEEEAEPEDEYEEPEEGEEEAEPEDEYEEPEEDVEEDEPEDEYEDEYEDEDEDEEPRRRRRAS